MSYHRINRSERKRRVLNMLRLKLEGHTYKQIAQAYGLSTERIRQMIAFPMGLYEIMQEAGVDKFPERFEHERHQDAYEALLQAMKEKKDHEDSGHPD